MHRHVSTVEPISFDFQDNYIFNYSEKCLNYDFCSNKEVKFNQTSTVEVSLLHSKS